MRVFTLFIFLCPAYFASAQNSLVASGTRYNSFGELMYGRDSHAEMPAADAASADVKPEKGGEHVPAKGIAVERTPVVVEKDTLSVASTPLSVAGKKEMIAEETVVKKCVGMWSNHSAKENLTNCYALHRQVPVGSTIVLKNPMNGRTVNVKVVGRLPDSERYNNISILVSAGAARQLNILDQKFIITQLIPESVLSGSK